MPVYVSRNVYKTRKLETGHDEYGKKHALGSLHSFIFLSD